MLVRFAIVACLLALPACSHQRGTSPESAPAEPSAGPVTADQAVDGLAEISGQLRAHDGSALTRAEVAIYRIGASQPSAKVELDGDGRFATRLSPGVYMVSIAAVDHAQVFAQLAVEGELRVTGTLGTYARGELGETLAIVAEYLDAGGQKIGKGPNTASRTEGNVYRLDLAGRPEKAATLRYQIATAGGRTYNGPLADAHESDGGGDFWSLVDVRTREHLELDLGTLPPAGEAERLDWHGEPARWATVRTVVATWNERHRDVLSRVPRRDGAIFDLQDEHREELKRLSEQAGAEIDAHEDPITRDLLRVARLSVFTASVAKADEDALLAELTWMVDTIAPDDIHLALLGRIDHVLWRSLDHVEPEHAERFETWLERRAQENPVDDLALIALEMLIARADARRDDARVAELFDVVKQERFDGLTRRDGLAETYDPDRLLQRGKPFPAFDFAPLQSQGSRITSADRSGRLYLLEFWATWCGPCVAEMPKLHATYAAINRAKVGKGQQEKALRRLKPLARPAVEFVFVSLDESPEAVETFRRQHWSMPWTHAFAGRDQQKEVMKRYGFTGVPMVVLIDENGTILETENALRGDKLLPTLERVLDERARESSGR